MARGDYYHFHKDCRFYPQCTEEIIQRGKHKMIKFTCPRLKHSQYYYLGDLHTIKWECVAFEPYQEELKLESED